MRIAVITWVVALGLALGPGCAPRFPNDQDHSADDSGLCKDCHFGGDAPQAPASHGDTPDWMC